MTTPDVDDRLTVKHNSNRRADVDTPVEVSRERLRHTTETLIELTLDLRHTTHPT